MSVFYNKLRKKVVCIWLVNLIIFKLLMLLEIMILIFHILVIFTTI